jgi:hypothetical protein
MLAALQTYPQSASKFVPALHVELYSNQPETEPAVATLAAQDSSLVAKLSKV